MSQVHTDIALAEPTRATPLFADSLTGFPSAAHMLDSRVWQGQVIELCFSLSIGYLLLWQVDVVMDRSVFSALGWSAEPPQDLGEPVGWLDAGGPLSKVPEAAGAGGSSHA